MKHIGVFSNNIKEGDDNVRDNIVYKVFGENVILGENLCVVRAVDFRLVYKTALQGLYV